MNPSTQRKSTSTFKIGLVATAVIVALVLVIIVNAIIQRQDSTAEVAVDPGTGLSVTSRVDCHRLEEVPDAKVTVVEFLDFECESCGAFYPYVESLRERFDGQINYIVRYFPLPSHQNSQNAAVAVEAAARQGQLEPMYHRMFETQAQWGESAESQAPLFRTFAEELGLDMAKFDADVADPTTLERVLADFNDGRALGVSSTPTFFINDRPVELTAYADLEAAVAAELSK